MAIDTSYREFPYLFKSRGIIARQALDRAPADFYLDLANAEERIEESLSSRFGSILINRDPDSTPSGVNYFLPAKTTMLARLKVLTGQVYRYANAGSSLYRRAGDTQGPYSLIAGGLSGKPFSSIVASSFQSALPYIFIWDSAISLKDIGTGTPQRTGIFGPVYPMTGLVGGFGTSVHAPIIEQFQSSSGFTTSGFTIAGLSPIGVVNATTLIPLPTVNRFTCTDKSVKIVQRGMLGSDPNGGAIFIISNDVAPDTSYFEVQGISGIFGTPYNFNFTSVIGSLGSNATGTIGKTVTKDFGSFVGDDLFVLAFQVSNPSAVQEIRLQFDVNGSNYTSSYYYKSIVPASYQGGVSLPSVTDATQAIALEVFARAAGITNLSQIGEPFTNILPTDDPALQQLQPSTMTTGASSWTVAYLRKGDFLPVGNAGNPGLDWSNITGWQVQITTTPQGSTNVAFNALYLQSDLAVGLGGGPSSYGGVGYDYRYTYYDAITGTESNPCGEMYFAQTPTNPTSSSTIVPLRQLVEVYGYYSADPQVTHVRIYRRGGSLSSNWFMLDQIPNFTGGGNFGYSDLIPDSQIVQASTLKLDNDVPVTSTLQTPIITALTSPLTPLGTLAVPVQPITINVVDVTAVFVPNQIVDIGTPANLEQVVVITGGTGTFTASIQFKHAAGEPVYVFSLPGVPCNLAAQAYNLYWLAGDPNNPHLLYYNNAGYPESFGPQNYLKVSTPSDPIMAVINFRGTLFVATLTTWYQIFPGSPPYAQTTGSKHGLVASFGWALTETAILYLAVDGIREFRGADGAYLTLGIEWLFQNVNQSLTPISELDPSQVTSVQMAYWNNILFMSYVGQDGNSHRIAFHYIYKRFRNDNVPATTLFLEEDTNTLLYAKDMGGGSYGIAQDRIGDYDDGGWVAGVLTQTPIDFVIQTPYFDQGAPNNQKQYNVFDLDVFPNGETLTLTLLWDDGGTITPITLPSITGVSRQKFQYVLNGGDGQQAYRVSLRITGSVTHAPTVYQASFHAAILPEQIKSFDTYWIKFGSDESKLTKQGYWDYTSTAPITVQLFADGATTPYYTFTLPANSTRSKVPVRVRYPAIKARLYRRVATSSGSFQFWRSPQEEWKPVIVGSGYTKGELVIP